METRDWVLLSGTASLHLAEKISQRLKKSLGSVELRRFSDGEIFVQIRENVRGRDVYVIQSTSRPVNETLMEFLVMIDALKRASAREISAVVPYYGYARQDRKVSPRTPISAKLVADLFVAAGATRMVSMDLHAGQIQGFFNIPFDNLFASPVILDHFKKMPDCKEFVIVSPDTGGLERARQLAERLDATVAVIDKRRIGPNMAQAMNVVGEVSQKTVVILDDMIDTAGTLVQAAEAVFKHGAKKVFAAATHGVLSGVAIDRIEKSQIEKVIVTDTLELSEQVRSCPKIIQLSVAELLAEAIYRIQHHDSVSSLFFK